MSIRTYADWATVFHVFGREEYSLKNEHWSNKIKSRYEEILQAGLTPLIVDCGSNIGAASNYFSLKFPKSKIVGIEISSENYQLALKNSLPGITQIRKGIASKSGSAYVEDNDLGFNGLRLGSQSSSSTEQVETLSIADLFSDLESESLMPFMCKIDIEGGEADLFSESSKDFAEFQAIVVEPHDWLIPEKHVSQNLLKFHVGSSRDLIIQGENVWSLSNQLSSINKI